MRVLFQIFKNFSRSERQIFIVAGLVFVISGIFVAANLIYQDTKSMAVSGGEYIEGVVGQPTFVNPVLVGNNSPDSDLSELLFANLANLAESYKVDTKGKVWNVRLKENLRWDDGEKITSDDVIFTIKTIQDPDSRSSLMALWQGVLVDRVSELEVKLTLPETYVFFENTIKELKVIPKHIFASIPVANFRLSDFNLEPIGSGPFKFLSFNKERSGFISEYQLVRNENYVGQKPYLQKIIFKFYKNQDELIKAFNAGSVSGFGGLEATDLSKINISHQTFEVRLPRYYAVFFNPYSQDALKDTNVRLALNYATDKKKIIEKVFNNMALSVDGPLMLGMEGYAPDVYPQENFSLDKARQILDTNGWQVSSDGVRGKNVSSQTERLEFDLIVPEIPSLAETANLIKDDWAAIGVKLNLIIRSPQEINDEVIKTRDYQMLLFGNIFTNGTSPDLYSFWHSAERFYPGLNLALYQNNMVDALIESIRKNMNESRRQTDLAKLQSLIIQDYPAVFLFSPNYLYVAENSFKGFEDEFIPSASQRFQNVANWYVKTARVFK